MIEYLVAGGPVMVPILLCSIVAMATFLERLWTLRRSRVVPVPFTKELVELVRQRRWGDALALCRKEEVAAARVIEVALGVRGSPRAVIKERLEEVGRREAAEMERYIAMIGTIGSVAPLLGLLGTVGGMILTFEVIEAAGTGDAGRMAGGISQALITTFAGLTVAIPAVIANRYLLGRVDRLLLDLEELSLTVLDMLVEAAAEEEGGASA